MGLIRFKQAQRANRFAKQTARSTNRLAEIGDQNAARLGSLEARVAELERCLSTTNGRPA